MSTCYATGCHITLIGLLKEAPTLQMNEQGNLVANMIIVTYAHDSTKIISVHNVVVLGDAALRIKQCAFPSVRLWIEGNIKSTAKKNYIVAEKIAFLADEEPSASKQSCDDTMLLQQSESDDFFLVEAEKLHNEIPTIQ